MSRDCWNRVSLCDPREPLPPLLRDCLLALDSDHEGKLSEEFREKLLPRDIRDKAAQHWRDTIWWAEHNRESASIEDTYVQFLSVYGPPCGPIDELAQIFGRSLRLLYINDMMGVCGYAISRPDGTVESRNYSLWKAPDWLIAEMGLPDRVWNDKWQMHIPATGTAFPLWSESQGWISPYAPDQEEKDQVATTEVSADDENFF